MTIRPATSADRARVEEIVEAAYTPWIEVVGVRPLPMDADYGALIEAGRVFVTGDGAGVIVLIPEDGALLVDNVAVDPSHHGKGVGRELLAHAEDRARSLGLDGLRLFTNERMVRNIALYERLGYREAGREEYAPDRRIVHMIKML